MLVGTLILALGCADKGAGPQDSGEDSAAHTGDSAAEPTYVCSGLADALGALGERDPDVTLFFPTAECANGYWSFEARTLMADLVADEVRVLPWDAGAGSFGAALTLTDDGAGTFTGEAGASEVGFSCESELDHGFVFAPSLEGRLGVLAGMGARGAAMGGGWGAQDGGDFGFEYAVEGDEVVSSAAVACNPVSGAGWGPYEMTNQGPSDDYLGANLWSVTIPIDTAGLGAAWEVLLAGVGEDGAGEGAASYFGGG